MDAKLLPGRALVTGASSGIGAAIARELAREGWELAIAARREDRLEALAGELRALGRTVQVYRADLEEPAGAADLAARAQADGPVDLLVNNAGVGGFGAFHDQSLDRQMGMIRLNALVPVELCGRLLPAMRARGRGAIVNVASTASFQPVPYLAVYAATKAFLLSFSESLAEEVGGDGVRVLAVCPGPTHTEFAGAAAHRSRVLRAPTTGFMSAEAVARVTVRALARGRVVAIPGWLNRAGAWLAQVSPRAWARRVLAAAFRRMTR